MYSPGLLYEPNSPRGDNGILYLNNKIAVDIPILFEISAYDGNNQPIKYIIQPGEKIVATLKESPNSIQTIYQFEYTDIRNNVITFSLSEAQVSILRPGITYSLWFTLYNKNGEPFLPLIKNLPVYIEVCE